MTQSTFSI